MSPNKIYWLYLFNIHITGFGPFERVDVGGDIYWTSLKSNIKYVYYLGFEDNPFQSFSLYKMFLRNIEDMLNSYFSVSLNCMGISWLRVGYFLFFVGMVTGVLIPMEIVTEDNLIRILIEIIRFLFIDDDDDDSGNDGTNF